MDELSFERELEEADYIFSQERLHVEKLIKCLNEIAKQLCKSYNVSCCQKQNDKHLYYQCKSNNNSIFASYHDNTYGHFNMRLVDQFVAFMGAHEVDFLINKKYETCVVACDIKEISSIILKHCKENFCDNAYVMDYAKNILAAMESTNVLQEEDNKSPSLGMPMHPQDEEKEEDGKNISLGMSMHPQEKEKKNGEQKVQEKEGWEPPKDNSNFGTQNSIIVHEQPS